MLARPAAVVPLTPERAREEVAQWPEWKREHALTKHSEAVQAAHTSGEAANGLVPAAAECKAQPTMSSREIAELTGKRHDNVVADIRKMLDELGKAAPEFSGTALVPGPNNSMRPVPVFNLPKDLTITLVSGYNVTMRHRIVTRWMELEAQQAPAPAFKLPQSFAEALRLAADLQEANEKLTVKPQKISGNI